MKQIALSLALSCLCTFSVCAQGGQAQIELSSKKVDFGTLAKGSKGLKALEFTNVGDVPLIISNVRSSCGCTVPTWPKRPIPAGGRASIEIEYDTQRVGPFRKSITIMSNAKVGRKLVKVVGEVKP